jgi:tetratricopeptide (TPR) repeat protein
LKLGHLFTQGTADSNQVWLSLVASSDGATIGESGALHEPELQVDPWAHFVNAYVIDRDGRRIDRRNPENIFTTLYNNQIPPGAADVVHYLLSVPESQQGAIDLSVSLKYRKFDAPYMRHFQGEDFDGNQLPVTVMAHDRVSLPVGADAGLNASPASDVPAWERWNDYGIGLLRRDQLRQAEEAFTTVEDQGHGLGALNLARVYLREGRLAEAADALKRAAEAHTPAPPWSISYFTAQLNLQNGYFDEAIAAFRDLVATRFQDARRRGFDFAYDYRLLNDLALALAERAKLERRPDAAEQAVAFRREAVGWYQKSLDLDPENATAHYGLAQLYEQLGEADAADRHRALHARYKVDDNARDRAVQLARRQDAAADRAANKVVIYELHRPRPIDAQRDPR